MLKKGNWLWTELLENEPTYYCKLFFFSDKKLKEFLEKHTQNSIVVSNEIPYFIISNDAYIATYLNSLTTISNAPAIFFENLLALKFEELILYLLQKYGSQFEQYLKSLVADESSTFKKIVKSRMHANLKLGEIAFLCNMSLSTFKRHFVKEYKITLGRWLQEKKLEAAKEILEKGKLKSSDIYLDFGYNNLSNFSLAFKNKFGYSPRNINSKS
ncbi:AraC family transcriptional regulator [Flavobacterium sp. PL12]|uniref:helix-turn-helix domain-containing protein n=1 Tax=Flavobacterium sp. PL12 TaxID=3071718 RepID=UPI00319D89C2